jgi:hypothetical protein
LQLLAEPVQSKLASEGLGTAAVTCLGSGTAIARIRRHISLSFDPLVKHSVDAAEIGLLVLQAPRHEMRRRPLARLVLGLFGFAALLLFVLVFGLLFKPAGSAQRSWPE